MDLVEARVQHQYKVLRAIEEYTTPPRVGYEFAELSKRDLFRLVHLLSGQLADVHILAQRGQGKSDEELADEAALHAMLTGHGADEAAALMLNTPVPSPRKR